MAKRKESPTPETANASDLQTAVDQLTVEVTRLKEQIAVLITAIDDIRVEVEWAARNVCQSRTPTQPPAVPVAGDNDSAEPLDAPTPTVAGTSKQGSLFD